MTIYKTANGKSIDMSVLMSQNEKVRAVGNANMNARGDIVDEKNKIVQANNERVSQSYQTQVVNNPAPVTNQIQRTPVNLSELTEAERELEEDDTPVIKPQQESKTKKK
jgi:hypothetical protein